VGLLYFCFRYNKELNRSINGENIVNIVKFIKVQKKIWLGHVKRMEIGAMPRKNDGRKIVYMTMRGRPHLRWLDDVVADLKVMKIKQWIEKTKDRTMETGF
jgi:hypothetical protein